MVTWFGYKIHLLVDTNYEMPISYQVTKGSASDTKHLLPLVEEVKVKHLEIYKDMDTVATDKGYEVSLRDVKNGGDCPILYLRTRQMLLRAEILRSVPLPILSLFLKQEDIANSLMKSISYMV